MTIKVTYNVTDVYVSETVSATYINVSYETPSGGGGAVWGDITGTLSDQTDLQAALDAKFDDPTGTTSQYLRGDGSLATFPTITSGTVTSVGLTMPSAFNVANSPITSSGTLEVTGAGTAAQYVRGDGQLATFPSNAGGGSSVNYYLNGSIPSTVVGYQQMDNNAIIGGGTDFTLTGNGLIAQFLTDVGNPNRIQIPGGSWNFEMYFQVSSSGGNQKFYIELHKYNGTTFTLISSSSTAPEEITGGTNIDLYLTSLAVPTTTLLTTDRLAVRVYIVDNSGGRTVTLHTENNTLCEIITTFAGGVASLNGLTANTQYLATGTSGTDFNINSLVDTHTFNLPTASATNRGALSTADWSAFNSKISGTGVSGQVAYWSGTNTQVGSNNLFWDNTNGRLGIGTATPSVRLHVLGADAGVYLQRSGGEQAFILIGNTAFTSGAQIRGLAFTSGLSFTNQLGSTEWARFHATGNFSIGASTDSTQRLQVTGDTLMKGSGATSATTALTVQNSSSQNILRVLNNGEYRIGNGANFIYAFTYSSAYDTLDLNGANFSIYPSNGSIALGGGTQLQTSGNQNNVITKGRFQPTSGTATFADIRCEPLINQTGGANGITRGLYVNPTLTAAADWRSIETSNNTGFAFYGAGTANSFFGGSVGINRSLPIVALDVNSTGNFPITSLSTIPNTATALIVGNNQSNAMLAVGASNSNQIWLQGRSRLGNGSSFSLYLNPLGSNVIVGSTSDTGELLQVNGTMKVTGNLTVTEGSQLQWASTREYLVGNGGRATMVLNQSGNGLGYGLTLSIIGLNQASGNGGGLSITPTINPTSGNAIFNLLNIEPTINQTSGANGITRGLYINSTITSAADWRAIEVSAGGAYINTTSVNASAILQADSTTKGFLPPRMTTTQKNAIATPAAGLQVYDSTLNQMSYYNGTIWINF